MSTPPTPDLPALRTALFAALAKADGIDSELLEPDDYEPQIAAVVPLVLAGRATRDAAVRSAAINEAADALDAQSCTCGCRRAIEFLRTLATVATPTGTTAVVPPCRCGHDRARHTTNQCRDCPGDEERSWRHPYTAAAPTATGGE